MTWLEPGWLWLLLPLASALLYRRSIGAAFRVRHFWLMVSALWIILAMCRPAIPKEAVDADVTGSDVIVAIDLSYSMQAADLKPNRLEVAKGLLRQLVLSNREDRFGVIGFTTNAIILSPLTNDSELLLHLVDSLDETLIITKGTELMSTLKLARKMSRSEKPKLLLLTDGGDALNYNEEALFAKRVGLQVDIVLLATRGGSTLRNANGTLVKDDGGNLVVSSRNDAIASVARASGGKVIDGPDLSEIRELLAAQKTEDYRTRTKVMQYEELFYFGILGAIAMFMLGMTKLGRFVARPFAVLLLLLGSGSQASLLDGYYLYRAQHYYDAGSYRNAAAEFDKVDDDFSRYNAANSYYKAGEYETALQMYRTIRSADPKFKAVLFYNMANCYIRLQEFAQARKALTKSLTLHDDPEARENLYALSYAEAQEHMLTGRQEGKQRAQQAQSDSESSEGKKKKGGGSNMNVSAAASGNSASGGKKAESDPRLSFSKTQGRLSSRQYELINQRSVHEEKPW